MADVARIRVVLSTGVGGAGVATYYCDPADLGGRTALGTFYTAWGAGMPPVFTWNIPASGDTIESTTGTLTGGWTSGSTITGTATGSSAYAGGTGTYIRWDTGAVVGGRRLRGRTFMVPMSAATYDGNGNIVDATLASLQTATNTLVTNSSFVIWHRPSTPGGSDGSTHLVTSGTCIDKVTSLRTRRS